MTTRAAGRQTHSLLDLKRQQWAKEREEISRLGEAFSSSQHHSSISHHKIQRTSIRTFYSNLDLSQTSSFKLNAQPEIERKRFYQYQPQSPVNGARAGQASQHTQQQPKQKLPSPPSRWDNNGHTEFGPYMDMDHKDMGYNEDGGDFENGVDGVPSEQYGCFSNGHVMHNNNNHSYDTANRLVYSPGQQIVKEVEEPVVRTAQSRPQNKFQSKSTKVNQSQRARNPNLPDIKQHDYLYRHHQEKLGSGNNHYYRNNNFPHSNNKNGNNKNVRHTLSSQPSPHKLIACDGDGAAIRSSTVVLHPGNDRRNRPNNFGCLEEDTSGYLSVSPRITQSPDIWFNDGESQNESNGMTGTGETVGTSSTDSQAGERREMWNPRSNYGHNRNEKQQLQKRIKVENLQEQEQLLNRTYVIEGLPQMPSAKFMSNSNAEVEDLGSMNDRYKRSHYITPSSSVATTSNRDVSSSNTYAIHPTESPGNSYAVKLYEERERAKWNAQSCNGKQYHQQSPKPPNAPGWLSRGPHDMKDSGGEDDKVSIQSSNLRGQNAPIDPIVLAERMEKRRKAAEYHDAIKQQLQERELIRKWEQERHRQEECLEEERIRQEKQIEKERLELERRQKLEREEIQRRKQHIMAEAIDKAQTAARIEKEKRRRKCPSVPMEQICDEINAVSIPDGFEVKPKKTDTARENFVRRDLDKSVEEIQDTALNKENKFLKAFSDVNANETFLTKKAKSFTEIKNPLAGEQLTNCEGDQVLIGTPINLKTTSKKSLESPKFEVLKERGICLIQPANIIPLAITTDIFGLQAAFGNLHIATNLTSQQLNTPLTAASTTTSKETQPTNKAFNTIAASSLEYRNGNSLDKATEITRSCGRCGERHFCYKRHDSPGMETSAFSNNNSNLEMDGFDDCDDLPKVNNENLEALIPSQAQNVPRSWHAELLQDADTQTEPLNCDLCLFHDNFYKVLLKREVSTTTTTQISRKDVAPDANVVTAQAAITEKEQEGMTTTTITTTTTTFKAKSEDLQQRANGRRRRCRGGGGGGGSKQDNRPKWGVNQPMVQYVKASDRDPFYMRHKKKSYVKPVRSLSIDSQLDAATAADVGKEKKEEKEGGVLLKARNICTEILPIKTDEKGRIFLDFRDASAIMNEDEMKEQLREKYFNCGKVLSRRSWSSADQHGSFLKGQAPEESRGSGSSNIVNSVNTGLQEMASNCVGGIADD